MSSWTVSLDAKLVSRCPSGGQDTRIDRLEPGNVLRLKAFRAFLNFKFHCLTFIQGLVTVHLNRREVDENVLSGLPLDEAIPLRSIELLHCALFLHSHHTS